MEAPTRSCMMPFQLVESEPAATYRKRVFVRYGGFAAALIWSMCPIIV